MTFYTEVLKKIPATTEVHKDMSLLEPGFRAKVEKFIAAAAKLGHKLEVLETYRSQERQEHLFAQGLTELRRVGVHGYGLAVDLGLFVGGKYDPKGTDYLWFVPLAKECDMISGVDWGEPCQSHGFKDYDHLQGVPLHRQAALFAGTWYPPAGYSPVRDK